MALLRKWKENNHLQFGLNTFSTDIDQLVRRCLALKADRKIAAFLVDHAIDLVLKNDPAEMNFSRVRHAKLLPKRIDDLTKILRACSAFDYQSAMQKLVAHVMVHAVLFPPTDLVEMVLASQKEKDATAQPAYGELRNHVASAIRQELKQGLRDKDEWSIEVQLLCPCQYCKVALAFARSKIETSKIWPLATQHRNHIMEKFNLVSHVDQPTHHNYRSTQSFKPTCKKSISPSSAAAACIKWMACKT